MNARRLIADTSSGEVAFDTNETKLMAHMPLVATKDPKRALVMIVGSDQFLNLPTWHRWEELFGQAHIAVARRANEPFDLKLLPGRLAEAVEPRLTREKWPR